MARFDLDPEAMLSPETMASQAVSGIHKDIDQATQGKPLSTTRSNNPMGNPQSMTVFSVAQILQGVPAYSSPTEALGRYQAVVDSSFLLGREGSGLATEGYMDSGLVPADVRQALTSMEAAERFRKGEELPPAGTEGVDPAAGGASGPVMFSQGDVGIDLLQAHPNIPYIAENFKGPAGKGQIDPRVLWVVKYLADNGCPIWITSGLRPGYISSSGNLSLHSSGKAVDMRGKGGGGSLVGDPWVTKVMELLDSLTGDYRPYEVGFLPAYKGGAGTKWINDKDNHIHVAYKIAVPATLTGGVNQPAQPATTSVPMQPISYTAGKPITVPVQTKLGNQHKPFVPNATQLGIIQTIVGVGQSVGNADTTLTPYGKLQLLVAGIETAWQESTMGNPPAGDRDSVGTFQQRPSQGWGKAQYCLSKVNYSLNDTAACAREFFLRACGSKYKNGKGTAGNQSQDTQKSAYPTLYDEWRNQAVSDLARLGIDASQVDP